MESTKEIIYLDIEGFATYLDLYRTLFALIIPDTHNWIQIVKQNNYTIYYSNEAGDLVSDYYEDIKILWREMEKLGIQTIEPLEHPDEYTTYLNYDTKTRTP